MHISGTKVPSLIGRQIANQAKQDAAAALAFKMKEGAAEKALNDEWYRTWAAKRAAFDEHNRTAKLLADAIRQRQTTATDRTSYLDQGGTDAATLATLKSRETAARDIVEHAETIHARSVKALATAEKAHQTSVEAQHRGPLDESPEQTLDPGIAKKPTTGKKVAS